MVISLIMGEANGCGRSKGTRSIELLGGN